MIFLEILYQGLIASLISVAKLAFIILPLMVMVELAKHYGWLDIISKHSQWFTGIMRLPGTTALPVLAGLFIGIVSGSGVILQAAREENYSKLNRHCYLIRFIPKKINLLTIQTMEYWHTNQASRLYARKAHCHLFLKTLS